MAKIQIQTMQFYIKMLQGEIGRTVFYADEYNYYYFRK